MIGEMHGTKEPANFVTGLTDLLISHGDSVQVGLELPSEQMTKFLASPSDSSVYLSSFFFNPPSETGRETFAWAKIISTFKNNPRVHLFFYDINKGERSDNLGRDSTMYVKVKKQILEHPGWKIVTISGNVHNMTSPQFEIGRNTMASFLKRDKDLDISARICSINHSYSSGTALNTYGDGLKIHRLGSRPSIYSTAIPFDSYIVLEPPVEAQNAPYPYVCRYYTKEVTAANMVKGSFDLPAIKNELNAILDRDQKTRKGTDSANYAAYIDSCNLVQIEALINKFGWPGKSLVGARGNSTVYLVIQHANLETQVKYLPMLQRSVDDSESRPVDLAYLKDRVLMRQGKKQIYGSQVVFSKTGAPEFSPIEDEKNVNARRSQLGLGPIEEYAKHFGIDYKPNKD